MLRGVVCFTRRLLRLWITALLISSHISFVSSRLSQDASTIPALPTVTVRGFLNFKTTVDGTVIVFTPASDVQATKPTDPPQFSTNAILHSNALDSSDGVENIQDLAYSQPAGLDLIKPRSDLEHQGHRGKESFQHISDNAVLPSTVQTNNDLETDAKKDIPPLHQYPTGLVTVLGGTHIEKGSTTVFETKVIGTYIDGKYAQILQSTSKIIAPTSVLSPQKEAVMTSFSKDPGVRTSTLSTTYTATIKEDLPSPTPSTQLVSQSSSYVTRTTETSDAVQITSSRLDTSDFDPFLVTSTFKDEKDLPVTNGNGEQVSTSSRNLIQSSFKTPEFTPSYKQVRPTQTLESAKTSILIKTSRFQPVTSIRRPNFEEDNTVASPNRNPRTSSTRIRFVAPRRPSQTVRLNRFKVKLTVRQDSTDDFELSTVPDEEQSEEDTARELEEDHPQEVTPVDVDPAQVVFQETTITSEVTLHVGRRKSVRTLTITTSVPVRVDPSDAELLLHMTDSHNFHIAEADQDDDENPDPSVVTRTYTTTERTLKTSLLPVFDGLVTSYHTVTESFFIMKIITAYRTLPPGDVTVLEDLDEPALDVTPTLDVAANIQSSVVTPAPPQKEQKQATGQISAEQETQIQSSIPYPEATQGNTNPHLSNNPLLSLGAALSNNPLAAVYLGLQQLNAQMTLYSTVTEVSTYVTTDTIYNTKTIRFYDGRSTRFRTISDPISTKRRTVTATMTSVQPYINTQALQQQQQLQKLIAATQLSPPRPQVSTVTSVYTTVTTATSLSTRIYTLIYNGFSTKFRTVTSSTLYPTTVTVTSTKEMPISPTQPPSVPFAYPYPA